MTTPVVPLADLAQRIVRQEAELTRLRQEYEARQEQLTELTQRKEDLQAQLQQVEAEIQTLGPTSRPAPTPSPARQAEENVSLPRLLVSILEKAPGPLTIKELVGEVERRPYVTRSGNLRKLVENRVRELTQKGRVRRTADQRFLLPAQPASTGKPSAAPSKSKTISPKQRQARAETARLATAAQGAGPVKQPSLREVLLSLLQKSRRPLSARELGEQVLASGYQTKSQDFTNVVWVALGKLPNVQNLPGQGWRLKRR
jgi:hypothetical protein